MSTDMDVKSHVLTPLLLLCICGWDHGPTQALTTRRSTHRAPKTSGPYPAVLESALLRNKPGKRGRLQFDNLKSGW